MKVPIYIQAAIHGNEYEGADAMMQLIERLATTPRGADPEVDAILDHAILVFNPVQNPDGRAAGTRANGAGFDLNRDFLTQSQPEAKASVGHAGVAVPGHARPARLRDADADRGDHQAAQPRHRLRPVAEVEPAADRGERRRAGGGGARRPTSHQRLVRHRRPAAARVVHLPGGGAPGPAVAEGWDDWGPFYTPMYNQLVGLNGSTVEMCMSTASNPATQRVCGAPGLTDFPRGRAAARTAQYVVATSTLAFDVANRHDLLADQLENYRRGVANAARPECCPAPFDVANNWMHEYPTAYVIPLGGNQRSDAEANRLAQWLLDNGIEVTQLNKAATFGAQQFGQGSYVVWMDQAHRGLIETTLAIGEDISSRSGCCTRRRPRGATAPCGAPTSPRFPGARASTRHARVPSPQKLSGASSPARPAPTCWRSTPRRRCARSTRWSRAASGPRSRPPPSPAAAAPTRPGRRSSPASDKQTLDRVGKDNGLRFGVAGATPPAREPRTSVPRIAVLTGGLTQEIWVLRNLGFTADPVATGNTSALNTRARPTRWPATTSSTTRPGGRPARRRGRG